MQQEVKTMKKLLVVTHGTFAQGIKESVNVITGDSSKIDTVSITVESAPEDVRAEIQAYIEKTPSSVPIFIVTDIPSGSTTACSAPMMTLRNNIYVLTGLNLGLLLALVMQPIEIGDIEENIRIVLEESRETVMFINDRFKQ